MPAFFYLGFSMMRLFLRFGLVILLAGCSGRSCVSEHRIHVLYRAPGKLVEGAKVSRGGQEEGFIEKIALSPGLQRVTLRVREASVFQKGDRFVEHLDSSGKVGLEAVAGPGDALFNGAEIEADPKFALRKYYADMAPNAPGGITLPSGVYVPFPAGLTDTGRRARTLARKERKEIETAIRWHPEALAKLKVSAPMMNRFKDMQERIKTMDRTQALDLLNTEGAALEKDLKKEQDEAIQRRDRQGAEDAKQLARRINRGRMKLEKAAEREKRMGPRRVHEGFVPPEFR